MGFIAVVMWCVYRSAVSLKEAYFNVSASIYKAAGNKNDVYSNRLTSKLS